MIVTGDAPLLWAAGRFGKSVDYFGLGATAIGNVLDGRICAAVVYNRVMPRSAYCHIVSDGTRRWATPRYMRAICHYPFVHLGKNRVTVMVDEFNVASIHFVRRMGFTLESIMEDGGEQGDMYVFKMMKKDCRWL